jgi:uncharacterized protein (DUF1501 family)
VDRTGALPAGLFAHNLQTQGAKTLHPQSTTGSTGVIGRLFAAFDAQASSTGKAPIKGSAYSITTDKTMFRGSPIEPVLLSAHQGMLTFDGTQTAQRAHNPASRISQLAAFHKLAGNQAGSVFAETHNDAVRNALLDSERISKLLAKAKLTQNWKSAKGCASAGHGQKFVAQLEQVSNVISARQAFDAEVDVFFVEMPGFDTHSDVRSR